MKIALACDHGGIQLKNIIKDYLVQNNYLVEDFGTYSSESCDYPDFAHKAAKAVACGDCDKGIVVCTTGIGVSMAANKVKGIRCALCLNTDMALMTRRHNDANMIAFGQKYVSEENAKEMLDVFLSTPFDGGRHAVRVDKIEKL